MSPNSHCGIGACAECFGHSPLARRTHRRLPGLCGSSEPAYPSTLLPREMAEHSSLPTIRKSTALAENDHRSLTTATDGFPRPLSDVASPSICEAMADILGIVDGEPSIMILVSRAIRRNRITCAPEARRLSDESRQRTLAMSAPTIGVLFGKSHDRRQIRPSVRVRVKSASASSATVEPTCELVWPIF